MKHSKTPWIIRELGNTCFIQAQRNNATDPYEIEVMGDDTNDELYPESQKRADAELIVEAVNSYSALKAELEDLKEEINRYRIQILKVRNALAIQDYHEAYRQIYAKLNPKQQ